MGLIRYSNLKIVYVESLGTVVNKPIHVFNINQQFSSKGETIMGWLGPT